jgi:hypothetical protein
LSSSSIVRNGSAYINTTGRGAYINALSLTDTKKRKPIGVITDDLVGHFVRSPVQLNDSEADNLDMERFL